ncbi:uncharacterized protein LOC136078439 [Hydra vulgaris]|uniref:Uncharacterized protein LOC136078439 n=1 Tax=Hydra vulgaris TaxID=6087 RepID=A0ABM4BMI7_HYDVU
MAAKNNVVCFTCSTCGVCKYSMQKYLEHMHIMHKHTAGYVVICNTDGCPASYKSVKCLREHMQNKHSSTFYDSQATINKFNFSIFEILESQISENLIDESNSDDLVVDIANNNLYIFQANLSNSPLDNFCTILKEQLCKNFLSTNNLDELLNSHLLLDQALSVVNSRKKIIAFSKSKLGLILPIEINLCCINDIEKNSANIENFISNETFSEKQNIKKETFQYVPILPFLKKLIEKEEEWSSIKRKLENDHSNKTNLLYSYSGGFICNNHNVFKKEKYALRLHFYIDEFEVCNPIGAHRTVHKICALYFYLGNIEEKYISRLQNIYLCIRVKEKLIKKHKRYEKILKLLIQDLKTLKNDGVSVIVDGQPIQLFGGLATISADNLSSHAVAGFRRVFNSALFCRQCMTTNSNKNKVFSKFYTKIRTHEMYLYHLEAILGPGKISSSMYGVERGCPFLDLPYFNISQSFPTDIMHDAMEGTIPQLISLLLLKHKEEKPNILSVGEDEITEANITMTKKLKVISSAQKSICCLIDNSAVGQLRFGKDPDKELHQWMGAKGNRIINFAKSKFKDEYVDAISAEIECEIDDTIKKGCNT